MSIIFIFAGILIALGVSALVAIVRRGKLPKAEESERAEIIKQLLALSEREASTSPMAPSGVKSPRLTFRSAVATDASPKGTNREQNSKPKNWPQGRKSPILLRPKGGEVEEQIRRRAYELYQQRGGVGGNPTDDWLQAKEEVLRSKGQAGKTVS